MERGLKAEGTFKVEGMLQGPMPMEAEDCETKINDWMTSVRAKGLAVSLDWSGGQFSLLAENYPVQSSRFTDPRGIAGEKDLSDSLQKIFELLLEAFPIEKRMELFSTLRSVEYQSGREIQTIYAVAPPGRIELQTRVLDAETVTSLPRLSRKGKLKVVALGLIILLISGLGVMFFFQPQLEQVVDKLGKLKKEDIKMELSGFEGFISVSMERVDQNKGGLIVEVTKGNRWLETVADPDAKIPEDLEWRTFFAVQSLRRGYVRCEIFDKEGKLVFSPNLRLSDLLQPDKEKVKALIPLPRRDRPASIRLVF